MNATNGTTLRDAFDKMMARGSTSVHPSIEKALLEAFMAGAAAYEVALNKAINVGCPKHLAGVQDAMALEVATRHNCESH